MFLFGWARGRFGLNPRCRAPWGRFCANTNFAWRVAACAPHFSPFCRADASDVLCSATDLGAKQAIICNISFSFDHGHSALVPWDQYTWGCRIRKPGLPREQGHVIGRDAPADARGGVDKMRSDWSSALSHASLSPSASAKLVNWLGGEGDGQGALGPSGAQSRPARNLLQAPSCLAGSHKIYETTLAGQAAMNTQEETLPDSTDPQWSCMSVGVCCDTCPVGKYQPLPDMFNCLSCPHGFTNDKNGSTSLSDCCLPTSAFGLYNKHLQTSFNRFGVRMATFSIYAEYHNCPISEDGGGCVVKEEVSTIPIVTDDVKATQRYLGEPGPFCADVQLSIQPMIGQASVGSLIQLDLDLNCSEYSDCTFDLGPQDSLNISFYLVSSDTVMPPELVQQKTDPPTVSRPRDPQLNTFASRKWKEARSPAPLDYTLDHNYPLLQFTGSDTPLSQHYKKWNCSGIYVNGKHNCPRMEKINVSTHLVIQSLYAEFNAKHEAKLLRFACEYEDPAADDISPLPWLGTSLPKCQDDYASRKDNSNAMTFNDYTPHLRGALREAPYVIGIRVETSVSLGHAGFSIGYTYVQARDVCRAGSFSPSGSQPCSLCPIGKFSSADGTTGSCLDCARGSYTREEGKIQCSLCPAGTSTVSRAANSSQSCRYFCRAGRFSRTGMEPCELCPAHTTQSKLGARYCDPCFHGHITTGKSATGFTNVFPWQCLDATDLDFQIEQVKLFARQLSMRVTWKIPEEALDVGDIVAIFKGHPYDSIRQLQWTYASAASCSGWVDDSGCRQKGTSIKQWASVTFRFDTAGPGNYSAVYFSHQKGIRMLVDTWHCRNEAEFSGIATMDHFVCPPDAGGWEVSTGLYVCDKGKYSRDGQAPCFDCPSGTISDAFASTECTPCQQGFYANPKCTEDEACLAEHIGLESQERCIQCPRGQSTLKPSSNIEDCDSCQNLIKISSEVSGCDRPKESVVGVNVTSAIVMTTPVRAVCGGGVFSSTKQCDDGNTDARDGCSPTCTVEQYYKCLRQVSIRIQSNT